ncbi:MAG: hypothetical protein NC548_42595 [Lachnospiraceae bacterium]|nr:hypothetical protein [Lachnospiraceae bacterium]
MKEIKDKLELIIEKSNTDKPACKNCKSFCDGKCLFGCVNERNMSGYRFNNGRITSPEYSCSNFNVVYNLSESTVDVLRDMLKDIERVNEGKKNLELLLTDKITEDEFVYIMR